MLLNTLNQFLLDYLQLFHLLYIFLYLLCSVLNPFIILRSDHDCPLLSLLRQNSAVEWLGLKGWLLLNQNQFQVLFVLLLDHRFALLRFNFSAQHLLHFLFLEIHFLLQFLLPAKVPLLLNLLPPLLLFFLKLFKLLLVFIVDNSYVLTNYY